MIVGEINLHGLDGLGSQDIDDSKKRMKKWKILMDCFEVSKKNGIEKEIYYAVIDAVAKVWQEEFSELASTESSDDFMKDFSIRTVNVIIKVFFQKGFDRKNLITEEEVSEIQNFLIKSYNILKDNELVRSIAQEDIMSYADRLHAALRSVDVNVD